MRPLIGITVDNRLDAPPPGIYQSNANYARCVAEAGGLPVLLPQRVELIDDYLARCDGFLFSGGDDIDVRVFGQELHPKAVLMAPQRQAFELALLEALQRKQPQTPVLGVCLGMQMMSAHAGGRILQHMHDVLGEEAGAAHGKNNRHPVMLRVDHPVLTAADGTIVSSHHQAVGEAPARFRVVAQAPDGTIEAVDDPSRPFYLGVQWHPERADPSKGDGEVLNLAPFRALVAAARSSR